MGNVQSNITTFHADSRRKRNSGFRTCLLTAPMATASASNPVKKAEIEILAQEGPLSDQ
jgi:hypothetical protein